MSTPEATAQTLITRPKRADARRNYEKVLAAARESFACHRTQYTPAEMEAINAYLAHAWNGTVWLRPWNGAMRDPALFDR